MSVSMPQAWEGVPASELKLGLLADVKQFCASQLRDDATLIVISALSSSVNKPNQSVEACAAV